MSATTVDRPEKSGLIWSLAASQEMPRNIVANSSPSATSVCRACFHSTARNARTPFESAPTPVIAVLPDASAWSATKTGTSANADSSPPVVTGGGTTIDPVAARVTPTTISDRMHTMNTYVGAAKILPDSRTPRRFPYAIRTIESTAISTRNGADAGTSAMIAATPAETDTATVST